MSRRVPIPGETAARSQGREEALAAVRQVGRELRAAGMVNEFGIVNEAVQRALVLLDEEEEMTDGRP